jgi:hypothetical protein
VGQIEMKCIFYIGKNISILAKVTQVSDVAHGPLVFLITFGMEIWTENYSSMRFGMALQ